MTIIIIYYLSLGMLLTVFYAAATWMQSRRFGSLRTKINQFVKNQASIVFYKIPDWKNESDEQMLVMTTSSLYCVNRQRAMIEEVLHFAGNTRSCALFPQVKRNLILTCFKAL